MKTPKKKLNNFRMSLRKINRKLMGEDEHEKVNKEILRFTSPKEKMRSQVFSFFSFPFFTSPLSLSSYVDRRPH
jgi:hypothetical protein